MFGLWFVFLVVIFARVRSQQVRKCCPQGTSLYAGQQVVCLQSPHDWIYGEFSYGLPAGCHVQSAKDCHVADQGTVASCIDNLNGTDSIVSVKCLNDTNNFTVPNVHYLRKCCPVKRVYDSILQTCWGGQNESWPTAFLNVLMYNARGVLDIRHGVPTCSSNQVVVDHLVTSDKVHRGQTASITFYDGGRKYVMNPDDVCVDRTERRDILVVRTCEEERSACIENACIRKCCPEEMSYYFSKKCTSSKTKIRPLTVYNITDEGMIPMEARTPAYWYGLDCTYEMYQDYPTELYSLAVDGSIYSQPENFWTEMGQFCIENVVMDEKDEGTDFVFYCFTDTEEEPQVRLWTTLGMLVSSLFLLITFIVYAALPSLKNLHGKTLMCHAACLLTAYICLSTVQLITDQLLESVCLVLGYITLFSFLSAFFWLNIISFDIWWTFGSMRPIVNRKKREWRKFLMYSAYAWINPTIITTLAGLTDHLDILPNSLRPGIGETSCWFDTSKNGLFLFFTGPVGVLLTINLVFFILTARHCAKVKSDLDKVGHTPIADNKFKSDRTRLVMNCKLFVAMGINWGLEFLSAVAHRISFIPIEVWYLSDMANACQGLVIFCIFVMKRRILLELRRRIEELLCCIKPAPRQPSVSTLFSGNNTTTSTDTGIHPTMKKCVSETRLSPLPPVKHQPNLKNQKKSQSTNRLLA